MTHGMGQNSNARNPNIRGFELFLIGDDAIKLIKGSSIKVRFRSEILPYDTIIHFYRRDITEEKIKVLKIILAWT